MFTNKTLQALIIPLFFEQLLVMLVGIADTFIVSYVSEAAVSGVSLVNMLNTVFIYLFTALASGGAVVISQYIGSRANEKAGKAASQLFLLATLFSVVISIVILSTSRSLLLLLFGSVEAEVMAACLTYLEISAYSYPALAIYNAGAALYRSMGKTSTTMYISFAANIINVVGNIIGVFVLQAGVEGVAYPSLIARFFSAVAVTILCFNTSLDVHYFKKWVFAFDVDYVQKILSIAIPNSIENGVHQLVKVALGSVVALFGTYQVAANGVAQNIWSLASIIGLAMGPAFTTVIGQCMGAGDTEAAQAYFKKLLKITLFLSVLWNTLVFVLTPLLMKGYALPEETKSLVILLVLIHNFFNALVFPFSGPLSNGLRAAGDVKFTMIVITVSTIVIRLLFSIIFGIVLNMGVIGIAYAMCLDFVIRAVMFTYRLKSGKWKGFQVI